MRVIANGIFYSSMSKFCKEYGLEYKKVLDKSMESDHFTFEGHDIRLSIGGSQPVPAPRKSKPTTRITEGHDDEPLPVIKSGKRMPLLSRVQTVGISTNWRG